jgi:hypothetical protein
MRIFYLAGAAALLTLGACSGGDRDRDRDRDEERTDRSSGRGDRNDERDDRGDRDEPSDARDSIVGRYVDAPPGTPCGDEVVEITRGGDITMEGRTIGTWRSEGGRFLMKQDGGEIEITRTSDGIDVRDDSLARCD